MTDGNTLPQAAGVSAELMKMQWQIDGGKHAPGGGVGVALNGATADSLGDDEKIRRACATAAAVQGAIAEGAAFDMGGAGKEVFTAVLTSTVIQNKTAGDADKANAKKKNDNNKRARAGKNANPSEGTKKSKIGANGVGLLSSDNHSSGSATSKPTPGTDDADDLVNIHDLQFVCDAIPPNTPDGKQRSSQYRGVTKHKRSGRWEAHIWVKETGKQMYLGGYDTEEHAAEAYDVAAMKCKGGAGNNGTRKVRLNFPAAKYAELSSFMASVSLEELVMAIRRQSQGFARGSSGFRGVTHHPNGRWEARIGMPGSKHIYLGLYNEEAAAARAYDRALVRLRGPGAATNYALVFYKTELEAFEMDKSTEKLHASTTASAATKGGKGKAAVAAPPGKVIC
jgi:hypothetical protein